MKKYFYNGSPIELGRPFLHEIKTKNYVSSIGTDYLTGEFANELVEKGILTCSKVNNNIELIDCIEYLAHKNHWSIQKTIGFISKVRSTCNAAGLMMVNKAAAVLLDKNYEGHIATAPEIWCISLVDMQTYKMVKENITDYMNFAAYRSKEDAEIALKIIKHLNTINPYGK